MFDATALNDALELHRRTYRLILWVGDAIRRGFIPFDRAHEYSTTTEAAEAWLDRHYASLPNDARPSARTGPDLRRYANFFVSYLEASFDLDADPTAVAVSPPGCTCPFCRDFATVIDSHLRPKKLRPKDKEEAQRLKRAYVVELANEVGRPIGTAQADAVLADAALARDAALSTYAQELLARCDGVRSKPAVLALWREIAWTKHGSPNHKFRLRTQDILKAERNLVAALSR